MTIEQEKLLSLVAHSLFGTPTNVNVSEGVLQEARAQAVSSIISPDYRVIANNIRVINAHAELTLLLKKISFTTFKGYASAYYYPEPSYRPMGDVDFIVDDDQYEETITKLIASGWKSSSANHARHDSFYKNGIELELHREIKGIPNGTDGIITEYSDVEDKVREYLSDLIETAVNVNTQQGVVIIPDDFHHGLIMLLHVASHMINDGGVGLRHLCDWAVYVNRVDFVNYRERLQNVGLWTFACQLTKACTQYLGLPKKPWTGEWPDGIVTELIEDILEGGNFGKKVEGRTATMAYEKSSYAEITMNRYPITRKHKILLPLFIPLNVIRYGVLMLRGKRKIVKPSTFSNAKRRAALYQQFELFKR